MDNGRAAELKGASNDSWYRTLQIDRDRLEEAPDGVALWPCGHSPYFLPDAWLY